MKQIITYLLLINLLALFSCNQNNVDPITLTQWKFKTGDNLTWAKPGLDDSVWDTLSSGKLWEEQGYSFYDGIAWYRIQFNLPAELIKQGFLNDSIQIYLGKIDDSDQTFLNGSLIGQNGLTTNHSTSDFTSIHVYNKERFYRVSVNDPRLNWNGSNTLAVRVYDYDGGGGIYSGTPSIHMCDIKDYLAADISQAPILQADDTFRGLYILKNKALFSDFKGQLSINVTNTTSNQIESSEEIDVILEAGSNFSHLQSLPEINNERRVVEYQFTEEKSGFQLVSRRELKYIQTPKASPLPKINGAKVVGASAGKPFLFRIPASGKNPMSFSAEKLPEGLSLDTESGVISGAVSQEGEYVLRLKAMNVLGETTRDLKVVIGNKLCLTPPMGWNSWNCWGLSVDESKVKSTVDQLIASGLADHGWTYINIDDGWEAPKRKANGEINTNKKFGSMKHLADYVHSKGLKLGIYSSPGDVTCGDYLGSYQHEAQDIKTYEKWDIDFLKYDWCGYKSVCPDGSPLEDLQKPYRLMQKIINQSSRDIVYSVCQYGRANVWEWGEEVGAQLWRTTGDIKDTWESMQKIGFRQVDAAPYAKPGHWNDPDMLVVGNVGWGPNLHPTRLTPSEQYTHISLWSLLSAPLLIGCDMSSLDDFTLNLLTNDEVIEINQDPLGIQATPVLGDKNFTVYSKPLEDGSLAVGIFNLSDKDATLSIDWKSLNLSGMKTVRDVWRQIDLGKFDSAFQASIPTHGVVMLKISN
jgi:alpha-galactosidase